MDEYFVPSLRQRLPIEPDLSLAGAATDYEDPQARLPDLVGEDSEYKSEDEKENRKEKEGLLMSNLSHISNEKADCEVAAIKSLGIAAWSLDDLRPADVPVSHSFQLIDDTKNSHAARRLPPKHNAVLSEEIYKMQRAWIITPSAAAWSFTVVIATTKDAKHRFCVDYRALNRVMKADKWPLPKTEEIFEYREGRKVFTTLDFLSGYWQVRMDSWCK